MPQKNDPDMTMSQSKISTTSSSQNRVQTSLRCISNNKVADMCLNIACSQKNVFQCLKAECQCRIDHKKCSKGDLEDVVTYVRSKIHNTQKLNEAIETVITKKINQLNELKIVLLKEVEERYTYSDMNDLERKFLKMVKGEAKADELKSVESKQIWENANVFNSNKKIDIFPRLIKCLNQFGGNVSSHIATLKNSIKKELTVQQKYLQLVPNPIASKQLDFQDIALSHDIIKNSLICQTVDLSAMLLKMFRTKVKSIQCLYTASKNEFSIKKYFEVCGPVPHTVIICTTNKDKIIGGYTPLPHDHENKNTTATDTTGQSFLFSLTDGEKFILRENCYAIYRFKDRNLIRFGNSTTAELQICDKANTSANCCTQVNYSAYYCPAYSVNDKSAYLKYQGNEIYSFTLKEWEVWRVQL